MPQVEFPIEMITKKSLVVRKHSSRKLFTDGYVVRMSSTFTLEYLLIAFSHPAKFMTETNKSPSRVHIMVIPLSTLVWYSG